MYCTCEGAERGTEAQRHDTAPDRGNVRSDREIFQGVQCGEGGEWAVFYLCIFNPSSHVRLLH